MNESLPTARWTVTQPWRGLFGLVVTLGFTFIITSIFKLQDYLGPFSAYVISGIPILLMIGMGWRGEYPSTAGLPQPWRGMLLTALVFLVGTLVYYGLVNFLGAGAVHPFVNIYIIMTVVIGFFPIIAFGMWPFDKLSLPARGWLTFIEIYVLTWLVLQLFNFSMLASPDGIIPSAVGAVPFYAKGGPFAPLAALAPTGPFGWESAISFSLWMDASLFVFMAMDMWPFHKFSSLMRQPVLGIVLVIACLVLSFIAYFVGVQSLQIEPLKFMLYGICFIFGLLMIMIMFQMWPGRALSPPVGGLVNIGIAIVIGTIAYSAYQTFAVWHFGGPALRYPSNIFAIATMMLGVTFPAWACYSDLWDIWPLPPSPPPPGRPGNPSDL